MDNFANGFHARLGFGFIAIRQLQGFGQAPVGEREGKLVGVERQEQQYMVKIGRQLAAEIEYVFVDCAGQQRRGNL